MELINHVKTDHSNKLTMEMVGWVTSLMKRTSKNTDALDGYIKLAGENNSNAKKGGSVIGIVIEDKPVQAPALRAPVQPKQKVAPKSVASEPQQKNGAIFHHTRWGILEIVPKAC
jgi:hypothetical protein